MDLDFIISNCPDLDLDLMILFKFFHNVWFSFRIIAFDLCYDIMCYNVIDLCKFIQVWFRISEIKTSLGIVQHTHRAGSNVQPSG